MRARNRATGKPQGSRGAILLGVLIVLLTISVIGATLASFFLSVTTVADVELTRAQALYLAEAGVAQAMAQLRQAGASGVGALTTVGATPLGDGTYEVAHDLATGLITATGTVRGVRRTVQVRYVAF